MHPTSAQTSIIHSTQGGCIGWLDGQPPRLAFGATREVVVAALGEGAVGAGAAYTAPDDPLRLYLTGTPRWYLPTPEQLLAQVAETGRSDVCFIINATRGLDPLDSWRAVETWIRDCVDCSSRAQRPLRSSLFIETRLPHLPDGFRDLLCRLPGWCVVSVLDDASDASDSQRRQERAAEIVDLGIAVEAQMALAPSQSDRWIDLARAWRLATRGGNLRFVAPRVAAEHRANRARMPDPEEVAGFLAAVYESKVFDLWHTEPFATLLRCLCSGVATVPRCGTPNVASIRGGKLVLGCRSGSLECARIGPPPCCCDYAPLCDVITGACRARGSRPAKLDTAGAASAFCRALHVLVPRLLEELTVGARRQLFLADRGADERVRAVAREGRLVIRNERLPAGHAPTLQAGEDAAQRDAHMAEAIVRPVR